MMYDKLEARLEKVETKTMKKMMFAFGAFAFAFAATAELDTLITFSTKGPDTYLDGKTLVADGECYALVWTKNGCEFKGLNADGSCVDPVNNALVLAAPIAKDHKCPPVMYVVKAADAAKYVDGEYGIYLLDTRVTTTEVDAAGNVTYKTTVAGVDSTGKPKAINGYGAVASNVGAADGELGAASAGASVTVGAVAPPPADAPKPKITAINIIGANVYLTVANTASYLQYNVAAGETPALEDGASAQAPVNGKENGTITLIVPKDGDKGFFKVQRN